MAEADDESFDGGSVGSDGHSGKPGSTRHGSHSGASGFCSQLDTISLLVIGVVDDGELPAHVAKGLHRSKAWTSYWLQRYSREGIKGLQNKPKSTTDSFRSIHENKKDVNGKQTRMDYQASK